VAKEADWAMPVLYLGAKNGKLFTWLPSWRSTLICLLILSLGLALWRIKPWRPHCPTPEAVDMDFVWIEPTPGSKISEPYCIGKFEVSRGEWEAVMGANSLPKGEEGDDLPAGVSYTNAQKFIRKLNEKEGKAVYRLPNEAEWEHAAMGPGNSQGGNCKGLDGYEELAPIGSFRTNDWDLYDMVGNVWEWVDAPDATEEQRVRRGGASDSSTAKCKATARGLVRDWNWSDTGFRVLRELPK
jgi:formylglycine-generating enzyme required for sulfatase activity